MLRHPIIFLVVLATLFQAVIRSQQTFSVRSVTSGLKAPWEIVWGPDDRLWVTERIAGRVLRVNPVDGRIATAVVINEVYPGEWQEGLLGMALHPDLLKGLGRDYVYVVYTYDADPGSQLSRKLKIRRYTYRPNQQTLDDGVDVIANLPAHDDHTGGRLVFGPDLKLYLSRGDNGGNWQQNYCRPNQAQILPTAAQIAKKDWSGYIGKILRINPDGSIPSDNPTLDGVKSHVYSYGHRNPQGLVFGPTGLLYSSEHGPGTDDEVNLILSGRNYGWPHVAGYRDDRAYVYATWSQSVGNPCASLKFDEYTAPPSVPRQKETEWKGMFEPPLRTFFTVQNYGAQTAGSATIAPSTLDIYTALANGIPGWANSLLLPGLTMGRVYRMKLSEDGKSVVGATEEVFKTANRYRDIAISRDPKILYLATDPQGLGRTTDPSGNSVKEFANPGAILEFRYQ